jgi:hypothetical protein
MYMIYIWPFLIFTRQPPWAGRAYIRITGSEEIPSAAAVLKGGENFFVDMIYALRAKYFLSEHYAPKAPPPPQKNARRAIFF